MNAVSTIFSTVIYSTTLIDAVIIGFRNETYLMSMQALWTSE